MSARIAGKTAPRQVAAKINQSAAMNVDEFFQMVPLFVIHQ